MEARRDVFQAIADPTRREIISLIANKSLNFNAIAENFDMARQSVSLHIKILEECGLIEVEKQGRERYCIGRLNKLHEVSQWLDQYRRFWKEKVSDLDDYLNKIQNSKKKNK